MREQWARHWLDVVRFAESDGFEYDTHRSEAWRYRDYVIRSIREDKPYDQFLREQLAGDEIDPKNEEMLVAAGFHRLGPLRKNAGNQDAAYNRNEILVEMTNVIGSGMLGRDARLRALPRSQVRPDPAEGLLPHAGVLLAGRSTRTFRSPRAEQQAEWKKHNAPIEAELKALREEAQAARARPRRARSSGSREVQSDLLPPLPVLQTVEDNANSFRCTCWRAAMRRRPGDQVGMRPLGVLLPDGAPEWPRRYADAAPGAREVDHRPGESADRARDGESHLAASFRHGHRRHAERLRAHGHAARANPELLDWLANRFVEGGWRMKPLHRLILLSDSSYPSADDVRIAAAYPAEELRDAMLAVSGRLNPAGGRPERDRADPAGARQAALQPRAVARQCRIPSSSTGAASTCSRSAICGCRSWKCSMRRTRC